MCLMKNFPACDLYEQNFGKIVIQMEKSCGHLNIIHHFVNEQHVPCVISSLESVKQMQKKNLHQHRAQNSNIKETPYCLQPQMRPRKARHDNSSPPTWKQEPPYSYKIFSGIKKKLTKSKRWFDSWPVWFRDSWEAFF